MSRKPTLIFIVLGVVLVLLLAFPAFRTAPPPHLFQHPASWQFTTSNAATSTFTRAQCDTAFPRLYQPINEAVATRANHHVQLPELDIPAGRCMFRALIYEKELYVIDAGDPESCYIATYRERIVGTLASIHKAIVSAPEDVPNIEFSVSYDDMPTRSNNAVEWGIARRTEDTNVWLMPDYGYWGWESVGLPSYSIIRRKINTVNSKSTWERKVKQAVWRGNVKNAPRIREKLIEVSKDKPWSDIRHADHSNRSNSSYLTVEELCNYMFVVQTEGTSYSGRLKYLLLCNSVTVAHKLEWLESHTHLMESSGPTQNFIETKRDWSDLSVKMDHYLGNLRETKDIAKRSYNLFNQRYLTPAAVTCYWRHLFDGWAKVQGFKPELHTTNDSSGELVLRGISYEAFIVTFPKTTGEKL